jgi:hypothetical protein
MIIFSASLPGLRSYLTERSFAYGLFRDFSYAIRYSGAFCSGTHCETGGGLRGVVNDLL